MLGSWPCEVRGRRSFRRSGVTKEQSTAGATGDAYKRTGNCLRIAIASIRALLPPTVASLLRAKSGGTPGICDQCAGSFWPLAGRSAPALRPFCGQGLAISWAATGQLLTSSRPATITRLGGLLVCGREATR